MSSLRPPRRGPYKRWINEATEVDLPKTTKWRRRCNDDFEDVYIDDEDDAAFSISDRFPLQNEEEQDTFNDQNALGGQNGSDATQHDDDSSGENSEPVEYPILPASEPPLDHESYDEDDADSRSASETRSSETDEPQSEQPQSSNQHQDGESDQDVSAEGNNFDKPLYENAGVTLGQSLLLLMSFMLGNGLTSTAMASLLKLLALLLPNGNLLPNTRYLFEKFFAEFRKGTEYHMYCPDCYKWLGTDDTVQCDVCNLQYDKQDMIKKGGFFIYIPLQEQLSKLLEIPDINSKINHRFTRTKVDDASYEDIYDGEMYKQLADGKLMNDPSALSISFNCDGIPVFRSSNYCIWPLQGILNELPFKERKENVFLMGLWFGNIKPVMTSFLLPFAREMKKLSSTGMSWIKGGVKIVSQVFACVCSADSVARCMLQNIKQFNGKYGCSWCQDPGESTAKGRGHCRVYPASDEGSTLRTHSDMLSNAKKAYEENECVFGVKGPTQLSQLPHFDLVSGFVVDNLHCIDLGVARQLGHLWFDTPNHQQPWYIGNKIGAIDDRLNLINPPNEVTRYPRSLSHRAYWKGSEWHWWLLLYAPVVLFGILPQPFYSHLLLLVEAVFLLSSSSISQRDINRAHSCLSCYVYKFEELYGKEHLTYNVHQLLHLTRTVIDWGPLSGYSSYIFEGFNMILLKLFHGTQAVPKQIASSFLLYKGVVTMAFSVPKVTDDDPVMAYIDAELSGCTPLTKSLKLDDHVTLLGSHYVRQISVEEKFLAEEHFQEDVEDEALVFTKAVVNGNVLYSSNYRRAVKRNNFTVGLTDNSIVEIVNFVAIRLVSGQKAIVGFAKNLLVGSHWLRRDKEVGKCCTHIKLIDGHESVLRLIDLVTVKHKYVTIKEGCSLPGRMCCRLPNLIDRD